MTRMGPKAPGTLRRDLRVVADMIEPGSRVLDVGCGDGELLAYLRDHKAVDARGIELGSEGVKASVAAGLSVIQGDANIDLADYPDQAFDYVVLSKALQEMMAPHTVLGHLTRIGRHSIVTFQNFGHWRVRLALLFGGRVPVLQNRKYRWYDTPAIHLCTIRDFVWLCESMGVEIERSIALDQGGESSVLGSRLLLANLFGEQAAFLLRRAGSAANGVPGPRSGTGA